MALSDSLSQLKNIDLSDLDADSIGIWPLPIRVALCVVLFVGVLAGWYVYKIQDQNYELDTVRTKEKELRVSYETKAFEAANLQAYREQLKELEKSFGVLLTQLPKDTEVPGLLEDITEIGYGSSLNIQSIELQAEKTEEFYVELPIRIVAQGGFHDIGAFVSGVAGLPRIVTLHDFSIKAPEKGGLLTLEIEARTYRYREIGTEEE